MVSVLVILASVLGIPVPMAQITTCSILGIATGQEGIGLYQKTMIRKIVTIWLISPLLSIVLAYGLIKVIVSDDFYTLLIMSGICLSVLGIRRLCLLRKERRPLSNMKEEG